MPTYEYECPNCKIFDVFQSITAPKLTNCPTCNAKVKRLLGIGSGVVFKGTGFYETDFKTKKGSSSNKSKVPPKSTNKDAKASNSTTKDTKTDKKEKKESKPSK